MKKLLCSAFALGVMAASAHAATVPGITVGNTDNGDGTDTFVFDFDPGQGDDITSVDGITFESDSGGVTFTVTAFRDGESGAEVIQDRDGNTPSNGGLGVNGDPDGDNLGPGELLLLTFDQTVNILGFTLNGNHTDEATGLFSFGVDPDNPFATFAPTGMYDGINPDQPRNGMLCGAEEEFCAVTQFFIASPVPLLQLATFSDEGSRELDLFNGYLESITVEVVPVPASMGFLLAGVAGLGLYGRKRRKS